jgi:hypothetical protein
LDRIKALPYLPQPITIKQQYNYHKFLKSLNAAMRIPKKSAQMRTKIFNLMVFEGLSAQEVSDRLCVPVQQIRYHIRQEMQDSPETVKIRADLADALTREKFYRDLIERLSRRLLWKTELRQPMPVFRKSDR